MRLTAGFTVKVLTCVGKMHEGELLTGLISLAIIYANNAHLDRYMTSPPRFTSIDTPPPVEERKPVSVMAIARILGLPVETTRRHVKKLIERGHVQRVKGGIIIVQMPIDEQHAAGIADVYVLLRRFLRQMEWAGVAGQD